MLGAARLLVTGRDLRRLVVAYALFVLVELGIWLALLLWAFERGGAAFASLVSVAQLVPAAVVSPSLSALGDRLNRAVALTAAHAGVAVTTGLTALALALEAPDAAVVAAGALATTVIAVVRPVHFAAVPALARKPSELVATNALCSAVEGVDQFAGPVLAGLGMVLFDATTVFTVGAVLAGVGALLCLPLSRDAAGAPITPPDGASPLRQATEGLRVLRRDPPAMFLLLVMSTEFVLAGALEVIGTAYATEALGLDEAAAGLLLGAVGIGAVAGAALASSASRRASLVPVIVGGGLLQGLAFAFAGLGGALVPAAIAVVVSGVGSALLLICSRTLLQRSTDDRVLARVFAVQESTALLGLSLGALLAPVLLQTLPTEDAFAPLGVGCALLVLVAIPMLRRLGGRAVDRSEEVSLLHGVDVLAALAPYALERLAGAATWQDVEAGASVVTQGEQGSEYYVVADGTLAVEVDGVRRGHTLGAGDGFGEIALLRSVPRTASVVALTPARLLVVRAEDFLAAVTGSPDGHLVAQEVAAAHLARDAATPGDGR